MASNEIPKSYDPLIELMEDAADGAVTHAPAIGLKQNTPTAVRADLLALTGRPAGPGGDPPAAPGLKAAWNDAKSNKTAKTAALRTAESNGRALAMTCINTLRPVLGNSWNSQWNAAGFTGSSLAVPADPMTLLQQLRAYYVTNPAREVPNVNGIACTAVACHDTAEAISAAQSESNQSNTDAGTAQKNFENGVAAARRRLTGLREELSQLLDPDDERWYAFGFDKPSDPTTPEVPENVTATAGSPGSRQLFINWDDARRATGYRLIVKSGTNGEAPLVSTLTQESEQTLNGLPAGATVRITVSARNDAGESQPSPVITAVVP